MKTNNPYNVGDKVRIKRDIRDAYNEIWHHKGDILKVLRLASDGEGLIFGSDLGIHYKEVELIKEVLK